MSMHDWANCKECKFLKHMLSLSMVQYGLGHEFRTTHVQFVEDYRKDK